VERAELAVPEVLVGSVGPVDDVRVAVSVNNGSLSGGSAFQDDSHVVVHKVLEREEVVLREGLAEADRGFKARQRSTDDAAFVDENDEVAVRVGGPEGQ